MVSTGKSYDEVKATALEACLPRVGDCFRYGLADFIVTASERGDVRLLFRDRTHYTVHLLGFWRLMSTKALERIHQQPDLLKLMKSVVAETWICWTE